MNRFIAFSFALLLTTIVAWPQNKFNYTAQWKTIDKLLQDGLPKSALTEIEKVYQASLKDKEYGQLIKSVMMRMTCQQMTEEKPQVSIINRLKKDVEEIPFPAKAAIYSLTGETLLGYYHQNRWKIYNRTPLSTEQPNDDMETWDASLLIHEIIHYYQLSLSHADETQKTPISAFKEALEGETSTRYLRPTLYDFLAHRAIDAFMQNNLDITDFADPFPIDRLEYFGDAETFVHCQITHSDTLSTNYQLMKLFQELTSFRLAQNDINALTDVNLKRFEYVKQNGIYADSNMLYEEAIIHQMEACEGEKIWGKAAYTLAYYYMEEGNQWRNTKNPKQRYRIVDAVTLCHSIRKKAILQEDKKYAENLIANATNTSVTMQMEKTNLPGIPVLASASYKNLDVLYINVYKCLPEDIETINRYNTEQIQEVKKLLAKLPRKASQQIKVPEQKDYQTHSVDIKIDSLPIGTYLLVVTDKPNPVKDKMKIFSYNSTQMTNIKLLQRKTNEKQTEGYVLHALSGKPLQGVKVDVLRKEYSRQENRYVEKLIQALNTDSYGMIDVVDDQNYNNLLRVIYGDDILVENISYRYDGYPREKQNPRTVLFTDRAIYRPGQTVYFKGLVYDSNDDGGNHVVSKSKGSVRLQDVNRKEIARQDFMTNEYGSFSGVFTIPQGLLNGQMQIVTDNGSVYFQVEEYKRPTFEVKMLPVTDSYRLGEMVTLTGEAKALAGYAVDEAMVQYRVIRRTEHWMFKRWYIYPPVYNEQRQIASGKIQTDDKGQFTVTFKAENADIKDDNLIYIYELTADITALNGETQSTSQAIRLSKNPILIKTGIPEKITASITDSLKYDFSTTNLDGIPTPANVQIELFALKSPTHILRDRPGQWNTPDTVAMNREEFEAYFPHDTYAEEDNPMAYPKGRRMTSWNLNTQKESNIDLSSLKDAATGWYLIQMKATSGQYVATDSMYISFRQPNDPITHMDEWITTVKNTGEPGEMAVFRIAGGNDSSLIRYDVLFKDKVVERKWLKVGRIPEELGFPIAETYRGGFAVSFAMVQDNRTYTYLQEIRVPYTNKQLDITFTTFRGQLLPGEKEKWTLTVKGKQGEQASAEMVTTLYDASLDAFTPHHWIDQSFFYPMRSYQKFAWNDKYMWEYLAYARELIRPDFFTTYYSMSYDQLNMTAGRQGNMRSRYTMSKAAVNTGAVELEVVMEDNMVLAESAVQKAPPPSPTIAGENSKDEETGEKTSLTTIPLRTNFNETAFFYPELRTNEKGEILVEFTVPDALTRWNTLGFAHTKDLKVGSTTNSLITQKQVAISANLPRFFRQGDTLILSAKVNNLTKDELKGNALLRLYDAFTMQPVDAQMLKTKGTQGFSVKAGQSTGVQWKLFIPAGLQAVTYRLTAQAANHTDGEERSVPVLSNRMLVTETMPFMVRADQRKDFRFDKLANYQSGTLQHHRVTLEYTSNPAWYAVQALPYLMEYPYECTEQTFARFYANALATAVANSTPRIKQIFDQWRSLPDSKALISNLEKNQDLKQALLEETPWVVQASNDTERKKRIGLLFDLNRMAGEQQKALDKLKATQSGNGGFPWFSGQAEDRFITQHIISGLEHLRYLRALPPSEGIDEMIQKALSYCDERIAEDYKNTLKTLSISQDRRQPHIGTLQIQYLYICSFSQHRPTGDQKAFNFYLTQAERYWTQFGVYEQAMIALVMNRFGKSDIAQNILRSLKERAQMNDDMGMYWTNNVRGYFWYQAPIETQALLIEAFNEAGNDVRAVGEMKIWLLRNKQTTDWKTTKATTEAIYALLATEDDLLGENIQLLDIQINGKPLKKVVKEPLRPEAGTGYVITSWNGNEVNRSLANLRITNPNDNVAWGAMYWQYFEDLDKITSAETNLQMNKQLFIKRINDRGKTLTPITSSDRPQVGDIVTVRLELRADRDFEYIHLKDMRAAGFEPVNTLSGYRYQGGLGYYESIKDASVNFFISYLNKGTYVFEYDLRVSHAGDFSNGITIFQCMYAPEFNAHSEGIRIKVNR